MPDGTTFECVEYRIRPRRVVSNVVLSGIASRVLSCGLRDFASEIRTNGPIHIDNWNGLKFSSLQPQGRRSVAQHLDYIQDGVEGGRGRLLVIANNVDIDPQHDPALILR